MKTRPQSTASRRPLRSGILRPDPDLSDLVAEAVTTTTDADLESFAADLGLTVSALRAIGAFLSTRWPGALCWPMRRRPGGPVVGVQRRYRNGKKRTAPGSRLSLLLGELTGNGPLLAPEGSTCAAAAAQLGFDVAARPSNRAGAGDLRRVAAGRHLVLFAEWDWRDVPVYDGPLLRWHRDGRTSCAVPASPEWWPGLDGAVAVALEVAPHTMSTRVVLPPRFVNGHPVKDLRDWIATGATREDVLQRIETAGFEVTPRQLRFRQ